MNIVLREPWSVERFLSWEDMQEGKHEFDGTQIIEMTGGTRAHQRIIFNLMRVLLDRLDPGAYDAVQEMRLEVAGKVRYPDVSVCKGRIPRSIRTIRDAVVVFEVLSNDTAEIDRREKPDEYAQLPNLRRYVLLEQQVAAAELWAREEGRWKVTHVTTGTIVLPEIAIELPLADIYQGV